MLGTVFKHRGLDITNNSDLHDLVKSFEIEIPRREIGTPNWDLDIVLKALCKEPFEPLGEASMRSLTKKTLFLVSLASAKRIGELQSLSTIVAFKERNTGDAFLQYLPEFLAKTESASKPLPREFIIKSLSAIVGRGEEERYLCPVRALKFYLKRTKHIPSRTRNLFVSCRDGSKPLSKNAMSFFLRETIKEAHMSQPEASYPRGDVRAHSIRGIATSINFLRNKSLQAVLDAATWRGNSIFASNYLKDVRRTYEHCASLGPIIASGSQI